MDDSLVRRRDVEAAILADSVGRYCPPEPVDPYSWALSFVRDVPAVDAVEVCRCPSCQYHEDIDGYHACRKLRMRCPNDAEFFCKYGQRREDGDA